MSVRTRSFSAGTSAGVRPAVSTGSSTRTTAVERPKRQSCLRSAVPVPWTASGRIGTPASMASRNAPSLNGSRSDGGGAGALRKDHHRHPVGQGLAALRDGLDGAGAEAPPHRDVTRQTLHPSHHGDAEQLCLGEPLHFPGEMADQQDVHERFVVRHYDVGSARVRGHDPRTTKPPERIQGGVDHRDLAEEVADADSARGRTAPSPA